MEQENELIESLAARLRRMAHNRTELDTVQLQLIDIEEIATDTGTRWPAVKGRAFEAALKVLKKRVEPRDLVIPCRTGFIVVFGALEGQAAEIAGLQLAQALNKFFLAEEVFRDFKFGCHHRALAVNGITNLAKVLRDITSLTPTSGTMPDEEALDEFVFRYQPVWDTKREVISTYFIVPADPKGGQRLQISDADPRAGRRSFLRIDIASIEESIDGVRRILAQNEKAIVGVRIHSATLADKAERRDLLDALNRIDPQIRRYLLIELCGIAPGFPHYHLDEQIRLIAQRVERVAIELDYDHPQFDTLEHGSVWAGAYQMPAYALPMLPGIEQSFAERLKRDARRVHQAGKRIALTTEGGADIAHLSRAADVDFVSALGIWPLVAAPRGVERRELPTPPAPRPINVKQR